MKKLILGIFAGVSASVVVVTIGDVITHAIFPPPTGVDFTNPETLKKLVDTIPTESFVCMQLFWLLSSFIGGLVAGKIAGINWRKAALFTGAIAMLAAVSNLMMLPHPQWMLVVTLLGYLPAAFMGGNLVKVNQA